MLIEKHREFEIHLEILDEDISPDDLHDWETEEERKEFYSKIKSGELIWFTAKVSAYKADILLASNYLGGCCYTSANEFLKDGYYLSMREEVINNTTDKIKELNEGIK